MYHYDRHPGDDRLARVVTVMGAERTPMLLVIMMAIDAGAHRINDCDHLAWVYRDPGGRGCASRGGQGASSSLSGLHRIYAVQEILPGR